MGMQDIDFEVTYEPGKDEADPLDYLSRHPITFKGNSSNSEQLVEHVTKSERASVIEKLQEETAKDKILQKLREQMRKGNWRCKAKSIELEPYFLIRDEVCEINGLVYRQETIVIPHTLQRKVTNIGHNMGHLGKSKTKQMMRARYWFPYMNGMIEDTCDKCYECKVAPKEKKYEPIKPTQIPKKAWDHVAVDFSGPL